MAAFATLFWAAGLIIVAPAVGNWPDAGGAAPLSAVVGASAMFVIGFALAGCGLILDSMMRARIEQKRMLFLAVPALGVQ